MEAVPIGTIYDVVDPDYPRRGWMRCDGRELERDEYPELFLVLGTDYGGGGLGSTTFRLPDLTGDFFSYIIKVKEVMEPKEIMEIINQKANQRANQVSDGSDGRVLSLEES